VVAAILPESLVVLVDARRASADGPTIAPVQVHLPPGVVLDAVESEPAEALLLRNEE